MSEQTPGYTAENTATQEQPQEKRAEQHIAILSRMVRHELSSLLLDDDFVRAFGMKLAKVMNGDPLYTSDELEVQVTRDPVTDQSFRVYKEASDHPTNPDGVYVFYANDNTPIEIPQEFRDKISEKMVEEECEPGRYYWATMVKAQG